MNVDDLQLHLSNLAQLLENAGGKKVAGELSELCQRLQPYRTKKLKELLDLIDKAEEIVRTGTPPAKTRKSGGKAAVDPLVVENLCNQIVDLYHRAKEPEITREQIEAAFGELARLNLTVAALQALAKRIDISRKLTKKDALETMMRAVLERKGTVQRVQV